MNITNITKKYDGARVTRVVCGSKMDREVLCKQGNTASLSREVGQEKSIGEV